MGILRGATAARTRPAALERARAAFGSESTTSVPLETKVYRTTVAEISDIVDIDGTCWYLIKP